MAHKQPQDKSFKNLHKRKIFLQIISVIVSVIGLAWIGLNVADTIMDDRDFSLPSWPTLPIILVLLLLILVYNRVYQEIAKTKRNEQNE
jgi:hypothetical protein